MNRVSRLDELAYQAALDLAASSPRADYTIGQLPSLLAAPASSLIPVYYNGQTYSVNPAALVTNAGFVLLSPPTQQAGAINISGAVNAGSFSSPNGDGILGVYNVKDFGALGNGTANDTSAIQAAITACNMAGGGIVFFPPGTYLVFTGLVAGYNNIAYVGSGQQATSIKMSASFTPHANAYNTTHEGIFNLDLCDGGTYTGVVAWTSFQGMTLDTTLGPGTITNNISFGVHQAWTIVQHLRMRDVYFANSASSGGVQLENVTGTTNGHAYDFTFEDLYSLNGCCAVNIYTNASGSFELSDLSYHNVKSYVNAQVQDDRILLSGHTSSGTGVIRRASIRDTFVWCDDALTTGNVNGVKVDIGNCTWSDTLIDGLYFHGSAAATASGGVSTDTPAGTGWPFIMFGLSGSAGYMDGNITLRNITAENSMTAARMQIGLASSSRMMLLIDGVTVRKCLSQRCAIELYMQQAPQNEQITIQNFSFVNGQTTTGNYPNGIGLYNFAVGYGVNQLNVRNGILSNFEQPILTGVTEAGVGATATNNQVFFDNVEFNSLIAYPFANSGFLISADAKTAGVGNILFRNCYALNPIGNRGAITLTGSPQTIVNNYAVDILVYVSGGTVSQIAVEGANLGLTSGSFTLPVGKSLVITYSVAPTVIVVGN